MIVFVGSSQHGFFIEDVARKLSLPYEYIAPASRINLQQQSIFDSIQKGVRGKVILQPQGKEFFT